MPVRKNRKPKSPLKLAREKIDSLAKQLLRKSEPYVCVTCPYWNRTAAREHLQWGHFITATKAATRWDPMNVHWQCSTCNLQHKYQQYPYTQYMLDRYGKKALDKLQIRSWSREGKPYTMPELAEIEEEFRRKIQPE